MTTTKSNPLLDKVQGKSTRSNKQPTFLRSLLWIWVFGSLSSLIIYLLTYAGGWTVGWNGDTSKLASDQHIEPYSWPHVWEALVRLFTSTDGQLQALIVLAVCFTVAALIAREIHRDTNSKSKKKH